MYCFKHIDENENIISLLTYDQKPNITNPLVVEITEDEYNTILAELQAASSEPLNEGEQKATIEDYEAALEELGV